jgi:hypothetical protein
MPVVHWSQPWAELSGDSKLIDSKKTYHTEEMKMEGVAILR